MVFENLFGNTETLLYKDGINADIWKILAFEPMDIILKLSTHNHQHTALIIKPRNDIMPLPYDMVHIIWNILNQAEDR